MLKIILVRFIVGGLFVSGFSILGTIFKPKSFAGMLPEQRRQSPSPASCSPSGPKARPTQRPRPAQCWPAPPPSLYMPGAQ